jgi:hypothetical protein
MAKQQLAHQQAAGRVGTDAIPDVAGAVTDYKQLCERIDTIRHRLAPDELYDTAYERFVVDVRETLTALCGFLGVEAGDSYLADCADVVWPQIRRTRDTVVWSDDDRRQVDALIGAHQFLAGYSWDS